MAVTKPKGTLKITLVRSVIGYPRIQREVVRGLGLRKLNSSVVRPDCPEIRGMVRKIPHLLKVEVLEAK
jgi:large subunit ribosomal protein L30